MRPLMTMPLLATLMLSLAMLAETHAASERASNISEAVNEGEYDEALAIAKKLTRIVPLPDEIEDVLFKAAATCVSENQLETAAALYRLFLEKFPDSEQGSRARAELVGCYNYLRQLDKCIAQARANLELEPDAPGAEYWQFIIGFSHFRLWKFEESKPLLEAYLAKYPKGEYVGYATKYLGMIDPPWEIGEDGLVAYSGKYEDDIRVKAALGALPEDKESGFKMLEDRLGVDLRKNTNVLILLEDSGPKTSAGLKASTYIVSMKNVPTIVVRFYSEYVARSPAGYRQTLTHEMKHAGFKGIMGQGYDDLPEWIKEGLAVWGSDDVETRLQLVLSNKIAGGKDPMTALDGVEGLDHDNVDYMEDALAFEWLEKQKSGNVKSFCRQLLKGRPYREVWAELSGMPYEESMEAANAHCRTRVESVLGGDVLDEFLVLRKAHEKALNTSEAATRKWLDDGGQQRLEDWISSNKEHPAEPMARFCLARSLAKVGQGDEARELLTEIVRNDSLRCTLCDDAQFWIGVSYNWAKDFDNAKSAFGVLLRDFTSSQSAKQVAGQFQPAPAVTE